MDRIIKTDKGIGPIDLDAKRAENFLEKPSPWGLTKPMIGVKLEGVKNAEKIRHNKSDLTPSKGRDKT